MAVLPYIPTNITVHLGRPEQNAENITLPFTDYIKNVASSEIYPTWPESALRANIYAIITFALNRIYTEWYPSRGYNFDITNSTAFDQAFQKGRDVFDNISVIVDEIYNDYVVRQGYVEPYFTQFCNGTTAKCNGLSQWGTVTLANEGYIPYEILQYYYGDDINIVRDAPTQNIEESYPGYPLRISSAGNDVDIIQTQLNRISRNYPAIPKIPPRNAIYDRETEAAVRKFQEIFNLPVTGEVDKATWYKIKRFYAAVKRLGELNSEGLSIDEADTIYSETLSEGMRGNPVQTVQYYLNVIAYFNPNLSLFPIDGVFGTQTVNAVENFQREYSLPITGIVDETTWNRVIEIYDNILNTLPEGYQGTAAKLYPGYTLTVGATGEDVRTIQTYLDKIAQNISGIPRVTIDGVYGQQTANAVSEFQRLYGLPVTGYVGPVTWYTIGEQYELLVNQ